MAETCNDFRVGSSPTWLLRVRNKVKKGSMRIFHFNSLTKKFEIKGFDKFVFVIRNGNFGVREYRGDYGERRCLNIR